MIDLLEKVLRISDRPIKIPDNRRNRRMKKNYRVVLKSPTASTVYEQGPLTRTEAEKLARTMNIEDEDRGNSMYVAERLSEDGTAMLDFMIRAMILVSATIVVLKSDEDFVKFIFSMLAVGVIISLIRQKE